MNGRCVDAAPARLSAAPLSQLYNINDIIFKVNQITPSCSLHLPICIAISMFMCMYVLICHVWGF